MVKMTIEKLQELQNMNKSILIILFVLLTVSCSSKQKKLETHPTGELNALEKFWDIIGSGSIDKLNQLKKK